LIANFSDLLRSNLSKSVRVVRRPSTSTWSVSTPDRRKPRKKTISYYSCRATAYPSRRRCHHLRLHAKPPPPSAVRRPSRRRRSIVGLNLDPENQHDLDFD